MPSADFQSTITAQYRVARVLLANGNPLVLLLIGADQTGVAIGHGAAPDSLLALAIGSQITAREFFKHRPPSPLELENAIVTVEDEVTRARKLIPPGARLVTTDSSIREIAHLSGMTPGAVLHLPLDAMERTFERLAQVSLGRPASFDGLPADNQVAATLLILREFMHHLRFDDITVLQADSSFAP